MHCNMGQLYQCNHQANGSSGLTELVTSSQFSEPSLCCGALPTMLPPRWWWFPMWFAIFNISYYTTPSPYLTYLTYYIILPTTLPPRCFKQEQIQNLTLTDKFSPCPFKWIFSLLFQMDFLVAFPNLFTTVASCSPMVLLLPFLESHPGHL